MLKSGPNVYRNSISITASPKSSEWREVAMAVGEGRGCRKEGRGGVNDMTLGEGGV